MPDRSTSDELLLSLMKDGDSVAFNILFERHWKELYSTTYSVCADREVCSEIVHDIFLNLWLNRGRIRIESFKGYIHASARYHVYRHLKTARRNSLEYHDRLEGTRVSTNQGDSKITYLELERKVEIYLDALPRRCREIFKLSRNQHLSNNEIAERLAISKRTVENQLTHALHHLRVSLKNFLFLALGIAASFF